MNRFMKLFDLLHAKARTDPPAEALVCLAQHLVHSALRDIKDLQALDEGLAPLVEPDKRVERAMRRAYEQAAEHAAAVIDRIKPLSISRDLPQFDRLQDEHCRLLAMLSAKPEDIAAAEQELREGKVHTVAELRDELCARLHR